MGFRGKPLKVKDLSPAPYNPRKISDKRLDMLGKSMQEFGDLSGIVFNRLSGKLIGGHQRIKHLRPEWEIEKLDSENGFIITPDGKWTYREVEWDEKKEIAANIAANKHGGEFDIPLLKDLLVELDDGMFNMELTGFDAIELKDLIDYQGKQGLTDDDAVPEDVEPISKTGDLWLLGDHRVLCGDATKRDDVERLMDGKKADMVFTDPPYNVAYSGRGQNNLGTIQNDDMDVNKFQIFLKDFGFAIVGCLKGDCPIYLCHGDTGKNAIPFYNIYDDVGWKRSSSIIWAKNTAGMGWQHYRSQHEVISYGWKGKKPYFIDDRTQTTVWNLKRDATASYKHPTQKPVEVSEKAIINSSKGEDIILDTFLGSGSTLIACEKTNRICYGMEIEPHYCDVIVKRWEDFTGKKATLEG